MKGKGSSGVAGYGGQGKMSKSFKIITLGCKVNQYESAFIEESLLDMGCRRANQAREAELVVVNTCIVTARASYQSRQALRRAIRETPGLLLLLLDAMGRSFPVNYQRLMEWISLRETKGKALFRGF